MEALNQTVFTMINAPADAGVWPVAVATMLAEVVIWLVPLMLVANWMSGSEVRRRIAVSAFLAAICGLLIGQVIGMLWPHPRPFMMGLGNTFMKHAAESSFPSDHLTLIWAVGFSLLMHRLTRWSGCLLTLVGLPVAWARIYLGVHFPLDMVGSACVALLTASVFADTHRRITDLAFRAIYRSYQWLFRGLIDRGWLAK